MTVAGTDAGSISADSRLHFLHQLNPIAKILGPVPAIVLVLFSRDVFTPFVFLVAAVLVLLIGAKLSSPLLVGILLGIPSGVLVFSLSFGLWVDPAKISTSTVIFSVGDYRFYLGAWLVGLATALRLFGILSLGLIAGLTTTGPDLVHSMIQQLRVPYRIGYTAMAAFRFVPRFRYELDSIRAAHRVRGTAGGHGILNGFRRRFGYIVPLLAAAIRHADRVALAMDARAFGADTHRTERHLVPFKVRDVIFILGCLAVTAVPVALTLLAFRLGDY